jgi:hypothetical protein
MTRSAVIRRQSSVRNKKGAGQRKIFILSKEVLKPLKGGLQSFLERFLILPREDFGEGKRKVTRSTGAERGNPNDSEDQSLPNDIG